MSYGLWALVIFLTFAAAMLGLGLWITRAGQAPPPPADPQPLDQQWYGPFPVDTGPLLVKSERKAVNDALERDGRRMVEAHEREVQAMIQAADDLGMLS